MRLHKLFEVGVRHLHKAFIVHLGSFFRSCKPDVAFNGMNALKLQIGKGQLHPHDQSRQARVAEWSAVDGNLRVEPGSHPVILLQSGFVAGAALNRIQGVADVPFIRNETVTDKVQLVVVFDLRCSPDLW